jgi:hypothetical protein
MEVKGKPFAEFNDDEGMRDFANIVEKTTYLNELNTHLHGKDQFINSMFDDVKSFKMKLRLWESQLKNKIFVHFPTLLRSNGWDSKKYVRTISELREEFDTSFQDFKKNSFSFNLFSSRFSTSIDEAAEDLQMECVAFQCASDLEHKSNNFSLYFYKNYVSQEK